MLKASIIPAQPAPQAGTLFAIGGMLNAKWAQLWTWTGHNSHVARALVPEGVVLGAHVVRPEAEPCGHAAVRGKSVIVRQC